MRPQHDATRRVLLIPRQRPHQRHLRTRAGFYWNKGNETSLREKMGWVACFWQGIRMKIQKFSDCVLARHSSYNCAPSKCSWKLSLFLWVSQFRTLFSSASVERGCKTRVVLICTPIFSFPAIPTSESREIDPIDAPRHPNSIGIPKSVWKYRLSRSTHQKCRVCWIYSKGAKNEKFWRLKTWFFGWKTCQNGIFKRYSVIKLNFFTRNEIYRAKNAISCRFLFQKPGFFKWKWGIFQFFWCLFLILSI